MKTPIQIRADILAAIPDLIGIRYFGSTVQPSILMLPDPALEDGGLNFPKIINGNTVKYQGIEIIIYRDRVADTHKDMLNNQTDSRAKSRILLKDHANNDGLSLSQINAFRSVASLSPITEANLSEGLFYAGSAIQKIPSLCRQLPPPSTKPDQAPLLDSIIFEFDYAGYI